MRKLRIILPLWLGLATALAIGFNNCGRVAFDASPELKQQELSELLTLSGVEIENGAPYTRDRNVGVKLFAPHAVEMKLSDKPDCTDGTWEAYATAHAWLLSKDNASVAVYAQFKDARGNISSCVSDDIIHDDVPPQLAFKNPAGFLTDQAALKVEWTATDNISGVDTASCVDPSAANVACASAVTVNASGDGTKTIKVKLKDKAGNSADFQYAWTLDMTPPTLTINQQPGSVTRETTATFAFTAADTGVGIDKVMCRKLPEAFQPCTSPLMYTGLADGSYTFEAYALDKAGNQSTPTKSVTWSVLTRAPGLEFTQTPAPISNSGAATFAFRGTDPAQPIVRFQCHVDSAPFADCTSPVPLTGLADGSRTFEVKGFDAAGNSGVIVYQWVIDTTPPTLAITSGPNNPSNASTADFVWTASDNLGIKTLECRIDTVAFTACPATGKQFPSLPEGPHKLDVRVTDLAGNITSQSRSWVIDLTPPAVTITAGPEAFAAVKTAEFSFVGAPASDVAFFECRVDSGVYQRCTSPLALTNVDEGGHSFFVRATDAAGNVSGVASRSWTVDLTPPVIQVTSAPTQLRQTDHAVIQYEVTDAGSGVSAVLCALLPATPAVCAQAQTVDLGTLASGQYQYTIMATDKVGNSLTKSVNFEVVATPTCKSDEVFDAATNTCKPFQCLQFTELTSFPVTIPARTADGICYYSKLFNAIPNGGSSGVKNANVLARIHEGPNAMKANANPYILGPGPASRAFNLQGPRAVKLSGSYRTLASIKVDNFFLIGQRLASESAAANSWGAYGTSDATVYGQNYVLAYNSPVRLQAFANGGTATVNALLLTEYFQAGLNYVLDVNALDCGGSKELSEIYLVWQ